MYDTITQYTTEEATTQKATQQARIIKHTALREFWVFVDAVVNVVF